MGGKILLMQAMCGSSRISVIVASGDSGSGYSPVPFLCGKLDGNHKFTGTVFKTVSGSWVSSCCALCYKYLAQCQGWTYELQEQTCSIYSKITATTASNSSWAGHLQVHPDHMYPSWPASSNWVTAVGSTRFINQNPAGMMS
eukprot:gene19709-992_t